jgi:hypothetical protein
MRPLYESHKDLSQVSAEFRQLWRITNKILEGNISSTTTIISGGGGSGGGGGTVEVPYRSASVLLSAGTTFIPFISDIGTSIYNLVLELYTPDGTGVGYGTKDIPKTSTGFTMTVNEPTIVNYTAIPVK